MQMGLIEATIAWAVVLSTAPRYVRYRRMHEGNARARIVAYWRTLVLAAAALSISIPAVYVTLDRGIGLPNAAQWMEDALILTAFVTIDAFFAAHETTPEGGDVRREERTSRLCRPAVIRVVLVVTLPVLALLLLSAGVRMEDPALNRRRGIAALAAYEMLYAGALAYLIATFTVNAARYARRSRERIIVLGILLMIAGAGFALLYCGLIALLALVSVLPAPTSLALPLYAAQHLSRSCTVALAFAGATIPSWSRKLRVEAILRHASTTMSCWRLGPLWRELTAAYPEIVLPAPLAWRAALLDPTRMDLLLNRRVVEILDARRMLVASTGKPTAHVGIGRERLSEEVSSGLVRDVDGTSGRDAPSRNLYTRSAMTRAARAEGCWLAARLSRAASDTPTEMPMIAYMDIFTTHYNPSTYEEQVHYLGQVATQMHRTQRSRRRRQCSGG